MKKILSILIITVVTLAINSCDNSTPKSDGEAFAKQLDELCQNHDAQGVVEALDIIKTKQDILEIKDPDGLKAFNAAIDEAISRNLSFITEAKIKQGVPKDTAINEAVNDVLKGHGNIDDITSAIANDTTNHAK